VAQNTGAPKPPATDGDTLERWLGWVSYLINRRDFERAHQQSHEMVIRYPYSARARFYVALAAALTGHLEEVHRARMRAEQCHDYTKELAGDFDRDLAIMQIKMGRLDDAEANIASARQHHYEDANRMACLLGMLGRLDYARGHFQAAAETHSVADERWSQLRNRTAKQWQYNNLVHWLRAVVAYQGVYSQTARRLHSRIIAEVPEAAKSRANEAKLIRFPLIGRRLYDLKTRRRFR